MARSHTMTPARRAALKKAQAASARKRRGKGKGKLAAANRKNIRYRRAAKLFATGASIGAVAYTAYKFNGKKKNSKAPEKVKVVPQSGNLKTKVKYKNPHISHRAVRRIVREEIVRRNRPRNSSGVQYGKHLGRWGNAITN